jgi:hypothetical protein
MAVKFINLTRKKFLEDNKRVYRFTNLERFIETLKSSEFTFINPSKWTDPFEKFFLEREYLIEDKKVFLPAKDRVFAVCMSGTISSEAYWKVYAPKEDGVRLTVNTEKLLTKFLDNIVDADVYIGKVNYQITKEFHKISFDSDKLIKEIESKTIGNQQMLLLLKKRKSFLYEDETRIIVVPKTIQNNRYAYKLPVDIREFTESYTLDPRLGINHVTPLREYFIQQFNFKVSHSRLYSDLKRAPIVLKKENKSSMKRTKQKGNT